MEKFIAETRLVPVDHDPFGGSPIERTVPTTEAQREVIVSSQMGADASCAYNESVSLNLSGKLDRDALDRAMASLIERHEALRAVISANGLRVIVHERTDFVLASTDLSMMSDAARQKELDTIARTDMTSSFDLVNGPLFRARLIRLGAEEHLLRLTGHHALVDGWSLGIIMADVSKLYSAYTQGTEPKLEPATPFTDYVLATIDFEKSEEHARTERFWLDRFKAPLPRLDMPTDRVRPRTKTYNGDRLDIDLDPALARQLKEVATRSGASFVTTLLTTFELLLHQITGDSDMVVGLPAAGQSDFGMKHLVGHCVNLLALRSHIEEDTPFFEHLKRRRTDVLDAFDNQKYTFGTLVRKLNVPREPGRIPLAPVVFNIDMNMDDGVSFAGLTHRFISNARRYENFELFLNATGNEKKLTLEWSYNTDLFDAATIKGWMAELGTLIARVHADPSRSIGSLTTPEKPLPKGDLPPEAWLGTANNYPRVSMGRLFHEVVKTWPDHVALELNATRVTYAELDRRTDELARVLIEKGVRHGDRVGLCFHRSVAIQTSMIAIVKAGGCYVPFDLNYPEERVLYMLDDSQVKLMLTQQDVLEQLPDLGGRELVLDDLGNPDPALVKAAGRHDLRNGDLATTESPAYILYTSGSTGKPKGVVIPHRAVVRLVRDQNYLKFGPDLTFLQLNNICFDATSFEQWGALLNGARLVLQPQAKATMKEIAEVLRNHKVDTCVLTSGVFNLMIDEHLNDLRGLKNLCTGGDAQSVPHTRRALRVLGPDVMVNVYGPTENAVFVSCYRVMDEASILQSVPIGPPVNNTRAYVLDEAMRQVPIGVKGELYCSGDGLALGYWNRPELTAERFVPDPFSPVKGARMYRTGDMARWLPSGVLEYLGRVDDQVKVRGMRVELGEIEGTIDREGSLKDRVVVVRGDQPGEKQVVAYLIPKDDELAAVENPVAQDALIARIRKHLAAQLPEHMVPSAWVVLERFPLNQSGKVDRKALPAPTFRKPTMRARHVAPRNSVETDLAAIWSKVLGVDNIGIHDNFFDIGGHSLIGIQLLSQVEQRFGKALPLKDLFLVPTVAQMASMLQDAISVDDYRHLSAIQPAGHRIPLFCIHGDEANYFLPKYLGTDQPFFGIFHQGEDGRAIRWTNVDDMAAHFIREMRAVRPHGPYLICGYSFGGIVAYEIAQQLRASGEEVPMLALFDTYDPKEYNAAVKRERRWYQPLKDMVVRRIVEFMLRRGKLLPPKIRHMYIIGTYNRAIKEYEVMPYNGPMTLMRTSESSGPRDMGWALLAKGGLDIRAVPGNHYNLVKEPHVAALAEELKHAIDEHLRGRAAEAG